MPKIVVGLMGSSVSGGSSSLASPARVTQFLEVIKQHRISELDTARVYAAGKSEELLGAVNAGEDFAISTKAPAFSPGSLAKQNISRNFALSYEALKVPKIDIYYLHGPDSQTPLEEQCDAIGELYREGKFSRFGVSNISSDAVRTIHAYCKSKGYVLPTVYQGGYNPAQRILETELFPTLRELHMAFYSFSPLAGGLFAKKIEDIKEPAPGSRFDAMKFFNDIYLDEATLQGLATLTTQCDRDGITVLEATMRWTMHHSALGDRDAVILGASTAEQVEANLIACTRGPLDRHVVECFDAIWAGKRARSSG